MNMLMEMRINSYYNDQKNKKDNLIELSQKIKQKGVVNSGITKRKR